MEPGKRIRCSSGQHSWGSISGKGNISSCSERPDLIYDTYRFLSSGYRGGVLPQSSSSKVVKQTSHLYLLPRPRMMELYLTPIHTSSWRSADSIRHRTALHFTNLKTKRILTEKRVQCNDNGKVVPVLN
jgi:hypothetical protein